MGFLSNIFKKKAGGTMLGNLIRGGASAVTGGLLGSGKGLQIWEQSEAGRKDREIQALKNQVANNGVQAGKQMVMAGVNAVGGQPDPTIGQSILTESLKKNWYFIAGGVIALIGLMYFIMKPKTNKRK